MLNFCEDPFSLFLFGTVAWCIKALVHVFDYIIILCSISELGSSEFDTNEAFSVKFPEVYPDGQTHEKVQRVQHPKRCDNRKTDDDFSPNVNKGSK